MELISNLLIRSITSHRNISALVSNHHLIRPIFSNPNLIRSISSNSNSNSNSSSLREGEGFLVRRFCRETESYYYSILSNENGNGKLAVSPDFRSSFLERMSAGFGSCDGAVHLCENGGAGDLLWKPWTNEFKVLPPTQLVPPTQPHSMLYSSRGFGFDSKSGDYKVLRFQSILLKDEYGYGTKVETPCELYSLRNNSWKDILDGPDISPCFFSRAYVNGCYHWEKEFPDHWETLISFDFATESFSESPLPKDAKFELPRRHEYGTKLLEFAGCLGTIVYERLPDVAVKSFELWVMKKEKEWHREFEIRVAGAHKPLAFSSDGRLLFLVGTDRQLLVYDLSVGELTKLQIYDHSLFNHMQVIPHRNKETVDLNCIKPWRPHKPSKAKAWRPHKPSNL